MITSKKERSKTEKTVFDMKEKSSERVKKNKINVSKVKENSAKAVFMSAAVFSVIAVFAIIFYILYASIPAFREIGFFNFIFGTTWAPTKEFLEVTERFGIFQMIVSSLAVTFGAVILGGTLGVFTAVFITYFCPKKLKEIFSQTINLLAGIPSIIYGFFGLVILVPMLSKISGTGSGKGLLACVLILSLMILPTVASISKNAMEASPSHYFDGAVALGSTKEQAVFKVVIPSSKSGIITGIVLGTGRAIGETMAVIMLAGNSVLFPTGLFTSIRTLTINIVLEMSYSTGLHREALIATGFVLLVFILLLNLSIGFLKNDKKKDTGIFKKIKEIMFGKKIKKTAESLSGVCNFKAEKNAEISDNNSNKYSFNLNKSSFVKLNETVSSNGSQEKTNKGDTALTFVYPVFRRKNGLYKFLKYLSVVSACIIFSALVFLIVFILIKGIPNITLDFLFGKSGNGGMTLLPAFITTGLLILISLIIALPIGIASAIYLVEYSKKGSRTVKIIRLFTDTLAGIPSIIFGLFGMILFCDIMKMGYSILAGGLTLTIIILPTIIRSTEESLLAVPENIREGSFALGAGKVRTIFKLVLPSALNGIVTAILLSIGRIVGESAALIYTAGAVAYTPSSIMDPGSSFAVMMWMFAGEGLYIDSAYATASVLLIITAIINLIVMVMQKKLKRGKV